MTGREQRHVVGFIVLVLIIAACLLWVNKAGARPPVPPRVFVAVRTYWPTRAERVKAFDVVACETGNRYNTTARNGQFMGLFQMGAWARSHYGHGTTADAQARAAHAYFLDAGWSPWTCAR